MRVTFAVFTLFVGLIGVYVVGAGVLLQGANFEQWRDLLLRPFLDPSPASCLVLAGAILVAFFSLTFAVGTMPGYRTVHAWHILLWGSLFCVLTAAGFSFLLYTLWHQGTGTRELGLVFTLATVQACLGLVLGGSVVLLEKRMRRVTVPILFASVIETLCAGAVVAYGFTV
jgi:hypothetical protein